MGSHKSATKVTLAVFIAILSTAWLACAVPVIIGESDSDDDQTPLLGKTHTDDAPKNQKESSEDWPADRREYELEKIAAIRKYSRTRDPNLRTTIDWISQERNILETSRSLLKQLPTDITRHLWKNLNHYVTIEYAILKDMTPDNSARSRITKWSSKWLPLWNPSQEEFDRLTEIDAVLRNRRRSSETLTETLLNFRMVTRHSGKNAKEAFEHAVKTAMKIDVNEEKLSDESLTAIAKALVRIDKKFNVDQSTGKSLRRIEKNPLFRVKTLSEEQIHHLHAVIQDEIRVFERRLWGETLPSNVEANRPNTHDGTVQPQSQCRYLPSQYHCFLTDKEYSKIVREVNENGVEKKVLETEKFMELLDRVTAEEPARTRERLLELGADLSRDPEVTLVGDSVAEFHDVVKPLNEAFSSQMKDFVQRLQLPEVPLRQAPLELGAQALPPDYLRPDSIYSSRPADRIGAYPQEIFHGPSNIHEPAIQPPRYSDVNYHVPMPEFHGQMRPVSVPESTRPVEMVRIAPPDVGLPTFHAFNRLVAIERG